MVHLILHTIFLNSAPNVGSAGILQDNFFEREFWGEPFSHYFWCFGIIIGTLLLKRPLANLLSRLGSGITERFSNVKLQLAVRVGIRKPMERLLQVILYYIAIGQLEVTLNKITFHHFPGRKLTTSISLNDVLDHVCLLLFIVFLAQLISGILDFAYHIRLDKASKEKNSSQLQLFPLMKDLMKLVLWTLASFWIMGSVFHVNIPALIAGLGIGGIAIALAGKETVENLFAAFTILTDKPFSTGDIIKLGEIEGTVERIGFRSTRLRHADGSAYIIPNQKLVGEALINLSWRNTRGIKIVIHIKYGVPHEALDKMADEIKQMLKNTEPVINPVDVILESYGEKTFQLLVSYHIPNPLAEGQTVNEVKHRISMNAYGIVTKYVGDNNASIPS